MDTSNLMRAQAILLRHQVKRTPARAVNSTAYFVIRDVCDGGGGFPVVLQSTIDSDMNVTTSPAVLKSGKLTTDKSRQHEVVNFDNRTPDEDDVSAMNTAMRIVLARMHPSSKFSIETGNRWGITAPSFGRGRSTSKKFGGSATDSTALFWAWVKEAAERMVKARHSSTGFLKKAWVDMKVALLPFALGKNELSGVQMGDYTEILPAREGSSVAVCKVANTLGCGLKTTRELSEKYNEANHQIAEPRIQAAINREFDAKMKIAVAKEWAADEPELAALGMLVKP